MRSILLGLTRRLSGWPPLPGSQVKSALLTRFGQNCRLRNLVETGTFQGDMAAALCEQFKCIVTIELDSALHAAARKRFADQPHIHVLHGDSGKMLLEAFRLANGPILFWLDAHYSGGSTARGDEETPIMKELSLIASRGVKGDVILIDDARLFGWRGGYPPLRTIRQFVSRHWPDYHVEVESDVICISPRV